MKILFKNTAGDSLHFDNVPEGLTIVIDGKLLVAQDGVRYSLQVLESMIDLVSQPPVHLVTVEILETLPTDVSPQPIVRAEETKELDLFPNSEEENSQASALLSGVSSEPISSIRSAFVYYGGVTCDAFDEKGSSRAADHYLKHIEYWTQAHSLTDSIERKYALRSSLRSLHDSMYFTESFITGDKSKLLRDFELLIDKDTIYVDPSYSNPTYLSESAIKLAIMLRRVEYFIEQAHKFNYGLNLLGPTANLNILGLQGDNDELHAKLNDLVGDFFTFVGNPFNNFATEVTSNELISRSIELATAVVIYTHLLEDISMEKACTSLRNMFSEVREFEASNYHSKKHRLGLVYELVERITIFGGRVKLHNLQSDSTKESLSRLQYELPR